MGRHSGAARPFGGGSAVALSVALALPVAFTFTVT
jgi:hypothetical protein